MGDRPPWGGPWETDISHSTAQWHRNEVVDDHDSDEEIERCPVLTPNQHAYWFRRARRSVRDLSRAEYNLIYSVYRERNYRWPPFRWRTGLRIARAVRH